MQFVSLFLVVIAFSGVRFVNLYKYHGETPHWSFLHKYRSPTVTPIPVNINSREAINENLSPISIEGTAVNKMQLVNDGYNIVGIANHSSTATITGGPLFNDVYIYFKMKYLFLSKNDENEFSGTSVDGRNGTGPEVLAFFYKKKYGSPDKAVHYHDGMAIVSLRLGIGYKTDYRFFRFANKIKKIRRPGTSVDVFLLDIIGTWLKLPKDTPYYTFPGSYKDDKTGRIYFCSIFIALPTTLSITREQFRDSFGQLKNWQGEQLSTSLSQYPLYNRPVICAKGFKQADPITIDQILDAGVPIP